MKKPKTRMQQRDRDNIRSSMPSAEFAKRFRLPRLTRLSPSYVNATLGVKSGFQTYAMEVGDATYRAITWTIKSTVEIVGKTIEKHGEHFVKSDVLHEYLDTVRLTVDGSMLQELSMEELQTRNAFKGISYGPVYSGFAFPGEHTYDDQRMTDAFALGTHGLDRVHLEIKLGAAFDDNTMEIMVMPHVVDQVKGIGFVCKTERLNDTYSSAGKHTYRDLPISDDISDIWIKGANIKSIRMEVDGDVLFDMDRTAYEAYLIEKGRDPSVLNDQWYIDFHSEGDPRSLAALDRKDERKRDARVKIDLVTMDAVTPVEFLVTHADLWRHVR